MHCPAISAIAAIAICTSSTSVAFAADAGEAPAGRNDIEVVEVIAPLSLDAEPANGQAATAEQIAAARSLDLADFMKRNLAGVIVNEAQGNPLQGDVQYRGFVGSPLLGLAQGIAIYQDGVRINEPFGDTVNWALIPDAAIDTLHLVPGSSPLFGPNALGGALALRTKNGFSHPGTRASAFAGSFGRRSIAAQTGHGTNRLALFAAASVLREDGWRDFSPTDARRAFAKAGWRDGSARLDLSITLADTDLIGNGPVPVRLRDFAPTAIYTRPDRTQNDLVQINLTGHRDFSDAVSATGQAYVRASDIDSTNGDDADDDDGEADADNRIGATIARTQTRQDGWGFGAQAARRDRFGAHRNRFLAGVAYDAADIDFSSATELGWLDETRQAIPNGVFLADAFTAVAAATGTASVYLSNTLDVGENLAFTATVRYNRTTVELRDQLGTALNGDHAFERLNPAFVATYRATPTTAFYAQYSESNRAPSPVELTCADEDAPCRLPNAFLADPPLAQVVARSVEFGARGAQLRFDWRAGWFRTASDDDILFISAGANTHAGYFDNVGDTRRQGWEFSFTSRADARVRWFVHGTILQATFQSAFSVPGANHPAAADGEITVDPGAHLPLVPERLLKVGLSFDLTPRIGIGGDVQHVSRQHFRGDEANLAPGIDGYTLVNLRADYRVNRGLGVYATIENLLDEHYASFGVFGDPEDVLGDDFADSPRFVSPGAPRAAWIGVEVEF